MPVDWVVVGLDNGGTMNNATVLDAGGRFLLDRMAEVPSNVREGPDRAMRSLAEAVEQVLAITGVPLAAVRAIGLDTPGPASADGVISSKGATNFGDAGWGSFDIRGALAERTGLPVIYNNDGNAAALYAHHLRFGAESVRHSSLSAIVGTGLGGGLIDAGRVIKGAAGMAGELGHVPIPLEGLLAPGQPIPACFPRHPTGRRCRPGARTTPCPTGSSSTTPTSWPACLRARPRSWSASTASRATPWPWPSSGSR